MLVMVDTVFLPGLQSSTATLAKAKCRGLDWPRWLEQGAGVDARAMTVSFAVIRSCVLCHM